MSDINSLWFRDRLRDSGKSMRALARFMKRDPSAVSRTLSGFRKMTAEEASEIAAFLNVSVSEVLREAGVEAERATPGYNVRLTAAINHLGNVEPLAETIELPDDLTDRARRAIGGNYARPITAAQVRASEGPLALWDDAVLLFADEAGIDPAAIGSLAICATRDGKRLICRVKQMRKTGEAELVTPAGHVSAVLTSAIPILTVLP